MRHPPIFQITNHPHNLPIQSTAPLLPHSINIQQRLCRMLRQPIPGVNHRHISPTRKFVHTPCRRMPHRDQIGKLRHDLPRIVQCLPLLHRRSRHHIRPAHNPPAEPQKCGLKAKASPRRRFEKQSRQNTTIK